MEIDIKTKKENKALNRTEIKFDCIYTGEATPKILAVKSKLVSLLNTKKDLIVVDSLQPHYGETKAAGYAKIYGSRDSLLDIETDHVLAKNKETKTEKTESKEIEVAEETVESETEVVEESTADTEVGADTKVENDDVEESEDVVVDDAEVTDDFEESEDVNDEESEDVDDSEKSVDEESEESEESE